MQSGEIPEMTWKQIVIDFIEPLPESIDDKREMQRNVGCHR